MNSVISSSTGFALQSKEYIDAGDPVISKSGDVEQRNGELEWEPSRNGQLCSSASDYMTGSLVLVDGGYLLS
jgi:hypothetical protein